MSFGEFWSVAVCDSWILATKSRASSLAMYEYLYRENIGEGGSAKNIVAIKKVANEGRYSGQFNF